MAMAMAPIPTLKVLWRKPPVLALAALPGTALGRLGEPSTASSAAWAVAGAAARTLHDAPLPPSPGRSLDEIASHLDGACESLVRNGVLPTDLVTRNRRVAEAALRPWTSAADRCPARLSVEEPFAFFSTRCRANYRSATAVSSSPESTRGTGSRWVPPCRDDGRADAV